MEQRANDLPGFMLPTWEQVQRTGDEYEPRTDDRLVVDSTQRLEETVRQVLLFLGVDEPVEDRLSERSS